MIRKKSILVPIAILLLGAIALSDPSLFNFEIESLTETVEVEKEELKEGSRFDSWSNFLSNQIGSFHFTNHSLIVINYLTSIQVRKFSRKHFALHQKGIPLFLKYSSFKIHLI